MTLARFSSPTAAEHDGDGRAHLGRNPAKWAGSNCVSAFTSLRIAFVI
jgi:hypothetical protein